MLWNSFISDSTALAMFAQNIESFIIIEKNNSTLNDETRNFPLQSSTFEWNNNVKYILINSTLFSISVHSPRNLCQSIHPKRWWKCTKTACHPSSYTTGSWVSQRWAHPRWFSTSRICLRPKTWKYIEPYSKAWTSMESMSSMLTTSHHSSENWIDRITDEMERWMMTMKLAMEKILSTNFWISCES